MMEVRADQTLKPSDIEDVDINKLDSIQKVIVLRWKPIMICEGSYCVMPTRATQLI